MYRSTGSVSAPSCRCSIGAVRGSGLLTDLGSNHVTPALAYIYIYGTVQGWSDGQDVFTCGLNPSPSTVAEGVYNRVWQNRVFSTGVASTSSPANVKSLGLLVWPTLFQGAP